MIRDALFDDRFFLSAVNFVIRHQIASVTELQREMKIDRGTAKCLLDLMEKREVVGPLKGGHRKVLVKQLVEQDK